MPDRQVKVTLVIDSQGAVHAVRAAGDESGRTEKKLSSLDKGVKGLGKSFSLLAGAGGLGAIAYGLKSVVSATQETLTATEKFHSVTGIGVQQSMIYGAALKARGVDAEAAGNAFKFLAKNMQTAERQEASHAKGKGKGLLGVQAGAFKELGIDLTRFKSLTEQAKLDTVVKQFEAMKDGAQKTRLEVQLFGRGGTKLSTVLEGGALGLSHMTKRAAELFPQLKGGQKGMEEWGVKQAEFKLATEGLEVTLGMKLIPVIEEVQSWFTKTIGQVEKGKGTWGELSKTFETIGSAAGGAGKFIKGIAGDLGIKLGGDTLGAVLAAAATAHVATKIPGAKAVPKAAKIGKWGVKYGLEHPYAIPAVATIVGGAYAGTRVSEAYPNGIAPGAETWSPFGKGGGAPNYKPMGYGRTELNGTAAPIHLHMHVGTKEVADELVKDVYAVRRLAEGVTHYGLKRASRE